jgi:hypothetical protein
MEKSEQRFIIKFFFLKSLSSKAIQRKLITVLGSTAYSLTQIKEWRADSRRATFHAKTNSDLVVFFTFCGKLSPISLKSFFLRMQDLLHNISISLNRQSKRSSNGSLGFRDSPEGK